MLKKKKSNKNHYFTRVHEDAIVQYAITEDRDKKTDLYVKYIGPAFHELVEKIVHTYRFTSLPNIDYHKEDCKIWLTTILDKYDPNKGSRAFSYFSVVTRNWFIHEIKKNATKRRKEAQYDEISKSLEEEYLSTSNEYEIFKEKEEFWKYFWKEIEKWDNGRLKPNEKKVLEAVKILFDNSESIEIFNKKAIYLYLREITGLNTKQVVGSLNKLRKKYILFRKKWNEGKF